MDENGKYPWETGSSSSAAAPSAAAAYGYGYAYGTGYGGYGVDPSQFDMSAYGYTEASTFRSMKSHIIHPNPYLL